MHPLERIKGHLLSETLLVDELRDSVFQFNSSTVVALLADFTVLDASIHKIHDLAALYKLDLDELQQMRNEIEVVSNLIPAMLQRAKEHEDALIAVCDIIRSGAALLEKHSMLTGLTAGFSLTGSRERVHNDHFNRLQVYSLSAAHADALELGIRKLLEQGKLVPIQAEILASETDVPELASAVQSILLAYGIGMARTPPATLFVRPPQIWLDLQEIAASFVSRIELVEQVKSHPEVADQLRDALPFVDDLIAKAAASGSVSLDGMFTPKKGVREIRSAMDDLLAD